MPGSSRFNANKDAIDAATTPLGAIQLRNSFSRIDSFDPVVEIKIFKGRTTKHYE